MQAREGSVGHGGVQAGEEGLLVADAHEAQRLLQVLFVELRVLVSLLVFGLVVGPSMSYGGVCIFSFFSACFSCLDSHEALLVEPLPCLSCLYSDEVDPAVARSRH